MTENCRVKIARFFDGTPCPPCRGLRLRPPALAAFAGSIRVTMDLLAPQRRDRRVHRVGDALAGDRLSRRASVRE